jgi:diacylglycerol kinase (ATP)
VRWTAIANPTAGRGRARKLLPRLAAVLAASGPDVALHVSTDPDHSRRLAREAFARGDGVLACGGDGTISDLAGVAAETGGLLAIVPAGSGNDFARDLGFDHRRPIDAIQTLEHGRMATVDLGRVGDHWFGAVAGTGFDAEANRWANDVKHLSGTPLYVLAVLRTLATYRPHRFRIIVDDDPPRNVQAWLLAVGNGSSYGGGMRIAPAARLDDGRLDLVVVGPVTRPAFLRTFPKVFRGTHVNNPLVEQQRCTRIRIESLDPGVPIEVYASGERVGPLPVEVEVVPRAVRVMVPAGSPVLPAVAGA